MTPRTRLSLIGLAALGAAMPSFAQETQSTTAVAASPQAPARTASGPQATGPQNDSRDVVVVTANKREESVQDIAVAVTAISSELRDEIGLTTVQDYTNFAPGLSYSSSNDRLGLRGVTRTSNNFGIRSGISNYVDGVYFSSAIPASREPIFTERVEVVRGPQGTLYGRDSIGGALNVISKRPEDEFGGQFNIGAGNFDSRKIEGRITGPITDWLRGSLAGSRTIQGEGHLINAAGLETEGNRNDGYYLEAQLEGDIGDRFTWWARYGSLQWTRQGLPGARTSAGSEVPYDTRFLPPGAIVPNSFTGLSPVATNVQQTGNQKTNPNINDGFTFNADFTNFAYLDPTTEGVLEAVYSFDNFDVKYLGGYVYYNYNLQQDNDGGPVSQFSLGGRPISSNRISDYTENRSWYSNEFNFISTGDGPFQWVAGVYQYEENYTQPIYVSEKTNLEGNILSLANAQAFLGGLAVNAPNFALLGRSEPDLPDFTGRNSNSGSQIGGDLYFHTNNQGLNHAYGTFIQGDYSFSDQWKVTAGIRWSKDVINTREYSRLVTLYATEFALENAFGPGFVSTLAPLIPPRIDVTATLGGADPSTVTPTNPCGFAGEGVRNLNTNVAPTNCADKTRYGIYRDPVTGNVYRDLSASWQEVTGVLGLDWTPDIDTLIYGKYNRGYKSGGLGAAATFGLQVPTPYADKELVDAFELGFKREWRDLNLTTNAVLFYYDYTGYQITNQIVPEDPDGDGPIPRPPAYSTYVNLPQTITSGFELETIWRPTEQFRLLFNYGYVNPEIGDTSELGGLVDATDPFAFDPDAQPFGVRTAPVAGSAVGLQGQNLDGNILPFSTKNKAAMIGTYTFDFDNGSTLDLSATYAWQDIAYTSIFNRGHSKIPSWDQTDARFVWTSSSGAVSFIGFVRNVFDELVYDSAGYGRRQGNDRDVNPGFCGSTPLNSVSHAASPIGVLAEDCFDPAATYRPPRTWGFELQYRF